MRRSPARRFDLSQKPAAAASYSSAMTPVEQARRTELERALRLLRSGHDVARVVEELSRRLTNKLLHPPTRKLREGAA